MIAVTGATGQLGQLVVKHLVNKTDPQQVVALARSEEKAQSLKALGVNVRIADYTKPETLDAAFKGVDKVLLISSSEVGQRGPQHKNVIDAALKANVSLLAYTSILHADSSPLALAEEHRETEAYLKESGIPHVLLRNGWYTENYFGRVQGALETGKLVGSAKDGRINSATRDNFAEAAAVVLTRSDSQAGKVYELAGDDGFTLTQLAALVSEATGKSVVYEDVEQAKFAEILEQSGIPAPFAKILANSDAGTAKGALADDGKVISQLIGHPTTPVHEVVLPQ